MMRKTKMGECQLMRMSCIMWLEQQLAKGNIPSCPTPTPTPISSPDPEPEPIGLPLKTWRARYELTPELLEGLMMTYDDVVAILLHMPEIYAEEGGDINLENSSVAVVKQDGETLIMDVTLDCEDWYRVHTNIEVEFIAFSDLSDVTDMSHMFERHYMLEKIPVLNAPNVTNADAMFEGCTGLTSIQGNAFPNLTGCSHMFEGCTGLTSIPDNAFPKLTDGYSMFYDCTGLTSIPEKAFPKLTDGFYMFAGCSGLTSIPANAFPSLTNGDSMFDDCEYVQRGALGLYNNWLEER